MKKISNEVSEEIATITFRNPHKLNAWDGQLLAELKATVDKPARREDVRAVVLTSETP